MKNLSYVLFAISLVLFLTVFLVYLSWVFYYKDQVIQNEIFYTNVNVTQEGVLGFDIDTESLNYGKAPPGTTLTRFVNLKNQYEFPIVVEVKPEGNIANLLKYQKSYHFEKNEEQNITFILEVPHDTKKGFYDGNVSFFIKRSLA